MYASEEFARSIPYEVVGNFGDNVNCEPVRGWPTNVEKKLRDDRVSACNIFCEKMRTNRLKRPNRSTV